MASNCLYKMTETMTAEAYPFAWPEGWPRTPSHQRKDGARFRAGSAYVDDAASPGGRKYVGTKLVTFDAARRLLADELERLAATDIVLSTNVPLRMDGLPRADAARLRLDDPGVAVYFQLKRKPMVMAQDAFDSIAANMRSLGLAIEAMRQLERHGGGKMMERAFAGFVAIAPPDWKKPWREVFGVKPDWRGDIQSLYREKAKLRHPDSGGSDTLMAELNVAYQEAKQALGSND
jgi:hypothetical protein